MMPRQLVISYQCFRESCSIHLDCSWRTV